MLSPTVQVHLWRTYNLPVLLSGLSAFPIRPPNIKAISIFHNKILRGFLKLSNSSPKPALYFLLGELPVEGRIHIATLMLFHTIWANPDTTVHKMTDYILMMSKENSTTWSNHVRILCKKYGLPCPLLLLQSGQAWSRETWKTLVTTRVTVYIEKELREIAECNSRMNFLNVKLLGLSGQAHPVLQGINTTQDVRKLRTHIKFLAGDFLTAERLAADQPNLSPACKLCQAPLESADRVLVACNSTAEIRQRILPELLTVVLQVKPQSALFSNPKHPQLSQFILDCSSINLGLANFLKLNMGFMLAQKNEIIMPQISADADGGPRSRVRTAGHSAQPPIDISGNFSAHVSAE